MSLAGSQHDPRTTRRRRGKEAARFLLWKTCEAMWRWQPGDDVHVTCDARPQGIGSQIHATLSVQLFAHRLGIGYCHTPFRAAEHAEGDEAAWVRAWESWLDLGHGAPLFSDLESSCEVVRLEPQEIFRLRKKKGRLYVLPYAHVVTDCFPDDYPFVTDPVRDRIVNRCTASAGEGGPRRLVVHVRRGDVSPTWNVDRFTSNESILSLVEHCKACSTVPLEVHIYSNGRPEDFTDFGEEFVFHLNDDARRTFVDLMQADILIMAKSALSYCAGLLSRGVVVYERFWSPPKTDWVVVETPGVLNRQVLSAALSRVQP